MNIPTQTIIEPSKGWQLINVQEMLRHEDLLYFLACKDLLSLLLGMAVAMSRVQHRSKTRSTPFPQQAARNVSEEIASEA